MLEELEKRDDELYSTISVKLVEFHKFLVMFPPHYGDRVKEIFLLFVKKHQNDVELIQKLKELIQLNGRSTAGSTEV